jgi:3-methyladenine DNA glycosylase AlkD
MMPAESKPMTAVTVRKRLRGLACEKVAQTAAWFFKTGPGQYGEGDVFIGVRVPVLRRLARDCKALPMTDVEDLLHSEIHEERLLALLTLVLAVSQGDPAKRKEVFDFYLKNTKYVNNWDLVDASAPHLVGSYLADKSRRPLYRLVQSTSLWERRIAVVATQYFIRREDFADTLKICRLLLADREDLIHKAAGWMLREVGKRHTPTLEAFLQEHSAAMPRTMLRYAIERFSEERRREYLQTRFGRREH